MPVTHDLKTLPAYFDAVDRGEKTFEIRRDDRWFQKGDIVRLRRLHPDGGFTAQRGGRTGIITDAAKVERAILGILTGGQFGLEPGYVILSLGPADASTPGAPR